MWLARSSTMLPSPCLQFDDMWVTPCSARQINVCVKFKGCNAICNNPSTAEIVCLFKFSLKTFVFSVTGSLNSSECFSTRCTKRCKNSRTSDLLDPFHHRYVPCTHALPEKMINSCLPGRLRTPNLSWKIARARDYPTNFFSVHT